MAGSIAGSVINIRNNQPIDGATVAAQPGDHTTTSGTDGKYSLPLDEGTYDLTVTASGFDPFHAEGIIVLDGVVTSPQQKAGKGTQRSPDVAVRESAFGRIATRHELSRLLIVRGICDL